MNRLWPLITLLLILTGCNGKGGAFSALEDDASGEEDGAVTISSYTPTASPVVMTSSTKTFAVALEPGAGDVTYSFALDGLVIQVGPEPFSVVDGSSLAPGAHSLVVTATNSVSSASQSFSLIKNTPPVLGTPTISATTVSCIGGTFTMSAAATDANGDAMTFEFFLNGVSGAPTLANTYNASSASTVFSPTCALTGINSIRLRVTDSNGEYDDETVSVTVSNPSVASIIAWSPTDSSIIVRSDETEIFSITPDGTPPFLTTWSIAPGGSIAGCPAANTCSIAGGGSYVGAHVLTASMDDGSSSPAVTRDFNVIFNAKPSAVPASISPSNASTIKKNCSEETTFVLNVVDSNYSDTTATNNIVWKVDGATVPSGTLTVVTNNSTHPFTSTATFKPSCQEAYLGEHTITAEFTDGFESDSVEWDIATSYMSTECLNLTAGRTCTLAGRPSLIKSTDLSVVANQKYASIIPTFMTAHPSGGLFISDRMNHLVWFYNLNASTAITVFGQVVPGQSLIPLVGTGAAGLGTDGEVLTNHYLAEPYGVVWDNASSTLYIADGANNRVVAVTGSGAVNRIIGGAATTDGSTSLTTRCNGPRGMVKSGNNLYVVCNGNQNNNEGHVKRFNLSTGLGYTVVRHANSGGNTAGTIGSDTTAARIRQGWGMVKHPSKEILFVVERSACQVLALNLDTNDTFAGVAVNANNMGIITLNGGCGDPGNASVAASDNGRMDPMDIQVRANGLALEGLYISQWQRGGSVFLNTTGSSISVGGVAVPGSNYRAVFGAMGASGLSRGTPAASNTTVNYSMGLTVSGSTLYMADHRNARIVTLDTSVSNGAVGDLFASEPAFGYDGEVDLSLQEHRLYAPAALTFNSTTKELLFNDAFSGRVRAINLTTGRLRTKLGNGTQGTTTSSANSRLTTPIDYITDIAYLADENLTLYSELDSGHGFFGGPNTNPLNITANGTFRSCYVRALNEGSNLTNWGVSLGAGFVTSVVGNYALGCQNWVAGNELQAPNSISYGPATGVGGLSDGSTIWSSHRASHCIQATTGTGVGTIETVIGLCGTSANTNGTVGTNSTARIDQPGDIEMDAYSTSGNFFFVDGSQAATSRIKYANIGTTNIDFDGDTVTDVPPGEVRSYISTTDGFVAGVAAYDDSSEDADNDWVCYSQGPGGNGATNAQNVICRSRDLSKTFRIGRSSSALIRAKKPTLTTESENILNTSAYLNRPYGLTFDGDGNLYIADYGNNRIVMVKKWW